jgi:nitrate/nitrite-specific signal transduction histidine kinase
MHDGPAQSLTNFILQAEICQRLFDRNPDRAAEELNNLKTVASGTFQKIRDFIFDLRPMMLTTCLIPPCGATRSLQGKSGMASTSTAWGRTAARIPPRSHPVPQHSGTAQQLGGTCQGQQR